MSPSKNDMSSSAIVRKTKRKEVTFLNKYPLKIMIAMRVYRINQLTSLSAFPVIFVIKSSILKDFAELSINLIHTFVVN